MKTRSSKRSPAASRTHPIFSAVAATVSELGSERWPDRIRGARPTMSAVAASQRERPSPAAADQERRMRATDRFRVAVQVPNRVVLAGEREGTVAEAALQDGDGLLQARLTDRRRIERQPDRVVFRSVPAGPDRHIQPAAAEHVQAGRP
jgi:hypothetical protein